MKLTFLDEEQLNVSAPEGQKAPSPVKQESPTTEKSAGRTELERCLDEEIARVLGEEDDDYDRMDHNADKKFPLTVEAPLAMPDEAFDSPIRAPCEGAEAMQGHEEIELAEETLHVECDNGMQGLVDQIVNNVLHGSLSLQPPKPDDDEEEDDDDSSATFSICSCEGVDREELVKELAMKESEKEEVNRHEDAGSDKTPVDGGHKPAKTSANVDVLQISYMQLGALKALTALLSCNQFMELLLIPKEELWKEKKDGEQPQADLQEALRSIMKQLVPHAIKKSPIAGQRGFCELERAQSILYQVTLRYQAETNSALPHIRGRNIVNYKAKHVSPLMLSKFDNNATSYL